MKKYIPLIIAIIIVALPVFALSPLQIFQGGTSIPYQNTGWQTGTLITGNGNNAFSTTSVGTGLSLSGGVLSATGGSGGSGNVSTSTVPNIGNLAYWTTSGNTPEKLGTVATGTVASGAGISVTAGQAIIGSGLTITNIGVTSNVAGTGISVSGGTGAVTVTNTGVTSLTNGTGTTCSGTSPGTCNVNTSQNITTLSNLTSAGTLNNTSGGVLYSTATSTPTVTAPLTYSGTFGQFIGGVSGTFGCTSASAGVTGCLTGTDWTTFNGKGSVSSVGVSSPNSSLSIGSTPITSSGTITADINPANTNSFSVIQKFSNSSTSLMSAGYAVIGATASTSLFADGTSKFTNTMTLVGATNPSTISNDSGVTSINVPTNSNIEINLPTNGSYMRDHFSQWGMSPAGLFQYQSGVLDWTNGGSYTNTNDTGLSRGAAGAVYVGNGTQGNSSGKLIANTIAVSTTTPAFVLDVNGAELHEPITAPTTIYKGVLWNDSSQNELAYTNGNILYQGGNLFTATGDQTINSTSPTTSFSATNIGTTTIAANSLKVGQKFTLWGGGYYSTPIGNTSTVTITPSIASTTTTNISTITTGAFPSSATNLPFDFVLNCTVRSIGVSATLVCDGSFNYATALSAVAKTSNSLSTIGTIKFDSTVKETMDVQTSWSAVTTQSATVQQSRIDFI